MVLVFIFKFHNKMNLQCLNNIISDNLAIHIDLTNINSWMNWNTGLTAFSLIKWSGAISDNINLIDFGLTAFDNGRTNTMWSGTTITTKDRLLSLYRVGYNVVTNPTSHETSGVTVSTQYLPVSAVSATGGSVNYFDLTGGYLQGFFKLNEYNYELLPARYKNGITIENILYLYPNSQGIFYMMGARAEDKYNSYFSGETITGGTTGTTGITTSFGNYLDAITEKKVIKSGFKLPEDNKKTILSVSQPIINIKNNVIAFELTSDKRLAYKYINSDGLVVTNSSPTTISTTGFTVITTVFTPNTKIEGSMPIECYPQRLGKLIFYINGRAVWILNDFPEYYFKSFDNNKEKQIGVPYSISWGGGSFGLKNSWHYDFQTYIIYNGQDSTYINNKFFVEPDPISTDCYIAPTGNTHLAGLSLSVDNTTFTAPDYCDDTKQTPVTVMSIKYTGGTGSTYFIKFNQPISVLSNRDYVVNLSLYNEGLISGGTDNKMSILMYSDTTDINIINDVEYVNPLTFDYLLNLAPNNGLHPWGGGQEYQYSLDGVLYYGVSGLPVTPENALIVGYGNIPERYDGRVSTGENMWLPITSTFRTPDNAAKNNIFLGLLIETNGGVFNTNGTLYIMDFTYTAADILVQDKRKNNLTIEQNFNDSFIGGIQKLRIYDRAFTSVEVLHNAYWESINNPELNIHISKGGRIIYR